MSSNDLVEALWRHYYTSGVGKISSRYEPITPEEQAKKDEERIVDLERKVAFLFTILPLYTPENKHENETT
jgi:exonuclease III